jgi:hypothetical protein
VAAAVRATDPERIDAVAEVVDEVEAMSDEDVARLAARTTA